MVPLSLRLYVMRSRVARKAGTCQPDAVQDPAAARKARSASSHEGDMILHTTHLAIALAR